MHHSTFIRDIQPVRAVILSRRRRRSRRRSAAGRRRISSCATPAETRWDSTQLGKLEILRRPPASSPAASCLRQPQDDSSPTASSTAPSGSSAHPPSHAPRRSSPSRRSRTRSVSRTRLSTNPRRRTQFQSCDRCRTTAGTGSHTFRRTSHSRRRRRS